MAKPPSSSHPSICDAARPSRKQASELYKQGEQLGDNGALAEAVNINRLLLTLTPRSTQPFRWANTQIHLGAALELLGERQGSTAQLDEAVAAYGEALKEQPRARVPILWAKSSGNQGIALMLIAERHNDVTITTSRAGGDAPTAANFEAQMPKARSLLQHLAKH